MQKTKSSDLLKKLYTEKKRQLPRILGLILHAYLTGVYFSFFLYVMKLEAGQVKLQSRLEEEEQAKAALMGRIQRLTKLILVSTKSTMQPDIHEKPGHRRRHSFGEDEVTASLSYIMCSLVIELIILCVTQALKTYYQI